MSLYEVTADLTFPSGRGLHAVKILEAKDEEDAIRQTLARVKDDLKERMQGMPQWEAFMAWLTEVQTNITARLIDEPRAN
jgi:hypothetical protein